MNCSDSRGLPEISIIMGIFNCERVLGEAVESIVAQTFRDWELILCDDGSSDATYEVAEWYRSRYPDKIILLRNQMNKGLNFTLNRCLSIARGRYIARMDADDRCSPERLEKELLVLEEEPELSIVSTDMEYFDENGVWGSVSHPTYPEPKDFIYGTPFCHAPCLVKKEAYDAVNGYTISNKLLRVEDYHLWIKMYRHGFRGKNIHEPLYQMRDDAKATARRKIKYRLNEAYVRFLAVKELGLPILGYVYVLRPVLVGLLPGVVYNYLHRKNLTG